MYGKNIAIVILVLVILGLGGYIVYDKKNNESKISDYNTQLNDLKKQMDEYKENSKSSETSDEITLKDLYGTYNWEKDYKNESGNKLKLKVQLVLKPDGSATYNASSGYEAEMTKGSYVYKDGKIIYTREYYNYDNGSNDPYTDNDNKTITFKVIDKDTLQSEYYDQTTELKK